jgi:hypothetical protein
MTFLGTTSNVMLFVKGPIEAGPIATLPAGLYRGIRSRRLPNSDPEYILKFSTFLRDYEVDVTDHVRRGMIEDRN